MLTYCRAANLQVSEHHLHRKCLHIAGLPTFQVSEHHLHRKCLPIAGLPTFRECQSTSYIVHAYLLQGCQPSGAKAPATFCNKKALIPPPPTISTGSRLKDSKVFIWPLFTFSQIAYNKQLHKFLIYMVAEWLQCIHKWSLVEFLVCLYGLCGWV